MSKGNDKLKDVGLLILRVGTGAMFIYHGWPLLVGGPEKWRFLGEAMEVFGIKFAPPFWGFMAAFSEFFGGICLILGVLVRPFSALLLLTLLTMVVAADMHLRIGDWLLASHPINVGIVFLSLIFMGAGRFSLSQVLKSRMVKKEG